MKRNEQLPSLKRNNFLIGFGCGLKFIKNKCVCLYTTHTRAHKDTHISLEMNVYLGNHNMI